MPGITLRVTTSQIPALLNADGRVAVQQASQKLGLAMAERTLAAAAPKIPVDEGGLLGSGSVVQNDMGAAVQYTAANAWFVNGAFDAGDRSVPHWPPIAAVQGWASRHGIPAFLVARAISQHGTKLVHFLDGAAHELESGGYDDDMQQALQDLVAALSGGG